MLRFLLIGAAIFVALAIVRTLVYGPSEPRQTILATVASAAIYIAAWILAAQYTEETGSLLPVRVAGPAGILASVLLCKMVFWNHRSDVVLTLFVLASLTAAWFGRGTPGVLGFCLPSLLMSGWLLSRMRTGTP